MNIARAVAERATCDRKHVGAVIVRDKTILSTGYNGSIRGMDHCDEAGHLMEDGHCVRTVHAEANAILQAAKNGTAIDGATLYSTASPCWPCFSLVANSGIRRIVFGEAYRAGDPGPKRVAEVAKLADIELVSLAEEARLREELASNQERLNALANALPRTVKAAMESANINAAAQRIGLDLSAENPVLALADRMIKADIAGPPEHKSTCTNCGWSAPTLRVPLAGCPQCKNKIFEET
jgi:dCMP deaminase